MIKETISNPENINPDRVKIEEEKIITREELPPSYRIHFDTRGRLKRFARAATASLAVLFAATNFTKKEVGPSHAERLADDKKIEQALKQTNIDVFAKKAVEELGKILDVEVIPRFMIKDANGIEHFNPGSMVVPVAIAITEGSKIRANVEIVIGQEYARSFNEAITSHPQDRDKILEKMAQYLMQQVKDQIVFHSMGDNFDTSLIYNQKKGVCVYGQSAPRIPVVKFLKFDNFAISGKSSGEANMVPINPKEKSLKNTNAENKSLAYIRAEAIRPLLEDALKKAGADQKTINNIKILSSEDIISDSEINELANISQAIFGTSLSMSNKQLAYELIREYNDNNPRVVSAIKQNPKYYEIFNRIVLSERKVTISYTVEAKAEKTEVYNIPLAIPLLFLLFPKIGIEKIPGKPAVEEIKKVGTKRRLFSEVTPSNPDAERDFNEIYDDIDLSEREEDNAIMLKHMLDEEILPSFDPEKQEPLIDYLALAEKIRPLLHSDTNKENVEKLRYKTPEEAKRKMAELLLSMWEKHDNEVFPMEGIDSKKVLNYKHSKHIVYWAKLLANELVDILYKTKNQEEFRQALLKKSDEMQEIGRRFEAQVVSSF